MVLLLLSFAILICTGSFAFCVRRHFLLSTIVGAGGAVAGCLIGLVPAISTLFGTPSQTFYVPWHVPFGSFHLQLDALAAWFLGPIFGLSLLAAIYGSEYLAPFKNRRHPGGTWIFFNTLIVSMGLVVLARDGVLFLMSWEIMSLASFFLVTFEHEKKNVRDAGWTYLVATHIGTAFLLALFTLLAKQTGSFDFDQWKDCAVAGSVFAGILFCLALVGFGTKAGFMPLHTWLPDAHPAAPSHVSAVMSGVMIKTGLYGLVRFITLFDSPPAWWGWLLIGIGASSGILGVLFALAQHDLKRLLAYHSIENVGIIALGFGIGLLGLSTHTPFLIIFGFSGGLLHVLNHALFKGLLFLGAGSVSHGTGTLDIEQLGGLIKRMPTTGLMFLIGSAAIAGLPPLNGFISEFLIYLGALQGIVSLSGSAPLILMISASSLTLIGGLAVACFAKAFGVVFLGSGRSEHAWDARESGLAMRIPMIILAGGCVLVGLTAPWIFGTTVPVLNLIGGPQIAQGAQTLAHMSATLSVIILSCLGFLSGAGLLWFIRRRLLFKRFVGDTVTWDCGYLEPSPRMQYTASSFAQPLTSLFRSLLRTEIKFSLPSGFFPRHAAFATATRDIFAHYLFRPVYQKITSVFFVAKRIQHGRLQAYVLYIGITLLVLLIWNLR